VGNQNGNRSEGRRNKLGKMGKERKQASFSLAESHNGVRIPPRAPL
jgi:hypothetical protein